MDIEYVDVVEDDDQLTSNSARNHTPIEMAVLYDRYNTDKGLSVQEIAERAGKSVPHVYKYLTAVRKWPSDLLAKVQSGELSFTAAQTLYEETRRKKPDAPENVSGTDLPNDDNGESGTVLPNENDQNSPDNNVQDVTNAAPAASSGGESGTDLPKGGTDKGATKSKKSITKSISDSLVNLIFGFEAVETDSGYQLNLTKDQYEAIIALQKEIEAEIKGK